MQGIRAALPKEGNDLGSEFAHLPASTKLE